MFASVQSVCTALSESSISATFPSPLVNTTEHSASPNTTLPAAEGQGPVVQRACVDFFLSLAAFHTQSFPLFLQSVNLNIVSRHVLRMLCSRGRRRGRRERRRRLLLSPTCTRETLPTVTLCADKVSFDTEWR